MVVDCVGSKWGTVVMWNGNVDFEVICFSINLIHGHVREDSVSSFMWLLIGVYGHLLSRSVWNFRMSYGQLGVRMVCRV